MQRLPDEELREALSLGPAPTGHRPPDRRPAPASASPRSSAQQLTFGAPTDADEAGLRRLAGQLRARKVVVKLFLRHPLHAKLYLLFRRDPINPTTGVPRQQQPDLRRPLQPGRAERRRPRPRRLRQAGGLVRGPLGGPLLHRHHRRADRGHRDELGARGADPALPIYLKMAYHLSQEARAGLAEFRIPQDFGKRLLRFQTAAVKIAAHHLNKRGGVLIGDVVGLGKTLMATALARIFEDDLGLETLDPLPEEPGADVGGLPPPLPPAREGPVDHPRRPRAARPPPLPPRPDRREPQPAEPRGQALPRHPGLHPRQRRARSSCSRPRPTTRPTSTSRTSSACSSPRTRTSASAPRPSCARSARPSSPPLPVRARHARSPSRRATTPTTGAS